MTEHCEYGNPVELRGENLFPVKGHTMRVKRNFSFSKGTLEWFPRDLQDQDHQN